MTIKLETARIENFKAIRDVKIPLSSGLTVLVGQNSSGKSSVLQALHWACRCVAHPLVARNQFRSISVHDFDFYPTTQIRNVGNNQELRQGRGDNPEVFVKLTFEHTNIGNDEVVESIIKIGQGNNEAVKVDLKSHPINKDFYTILRDRGRPFSSYIPGLAGVPLTEEKRSRRPIVRQAASGDANTVLRNILLLIKEDPREDVSLEKLSRLCSEVLGNISIKVEFDEIRDSAILAKIHTEAMSNDYWAPLEMAGTGVLQCIQIFAYIILYRPYLLLIDEPDAHLHPDRQEKLVTALAQVATEYSMSVVMTTHSPNVVRAMPASAKIVWMNNGSVQKEDEEAVRQRMGWGILDKKVLFVTEDGKPDELKSIIRQWPELDRIITVWPVSGYHSLPTLDACKALLNMTGMQYMVLHRDGDFMTQEEREKLQDKYRDDNIRFWITDDSDIEALFLDRGRVSRVMGLERDEVDQIYQEILHVNEVDFEDAFSAKRRELAENRRLYHHRDEAPGTASAKCQIKETVEGFGSIHGKSFAKKLKAKLNEKGLDATKLLMPDTNENDIGNSLRETLGQLVN